MSARQILLNVLGNKCQECGSTENLEIHHKDKNPENNNIQNIQVVCHSCHLKEHGKGLGLSREILEILKKQPRQTPQSLLNKLDVSMSAIRNNLMVLSDLKLVETKTRGLYNITPLGEHVLEEIKK